eukprot:c5652_g1_i1 orf=1-189(-)
MALVGCMQHNLSLGYAERESLMIWRKQSMRHPRFTKHQTLLCAPCSVNKLQNDNNYPVKNELI